MRNKKITILLLSILFTVVLGVYYAQPFLPDSQDTHFDFTAVEGNLEEIENLHYTSSLGHDGSMLLDITPENTERLDSVFLGSIYTYQLSDIKRWQEDYRSFMRKKESSISNFFEEDDALFYIDDFTRNWSKEGEKNVTLQIERLDKETNEVTIKEMNIESTDEIEFVSYQNICKAGPYLAIQAYINTSQTQIYSTYIYNWETEEIVDEIEPGDSYDYWSGDTNLYIEVLDKENPKFLLNKRNYSYEPTPSDNSEEEWQDGKIENEYQIYNPESKDSKEVLLPYELTDDTVRYALGEGNIIFTEKSADNFLITIFDIENQKVIKEKVISIQSDTFSEEDYFYVMKQDSKLLITQSYLEPDALYAGIVKVDLKNFEKRFEGTIEVDKKSIESLENRMIYFDTIYFE